MGNQYSWPVLGFLLSEKEKIELCVAVKGTCTRGSGRDPAGAVTADHTIVFIAWALCVPLQHGDNGLIDDLKKEANRDQTRDLQRGRRTDFVLLSTV